ncbi:MAG TPA: hypothetical protein VJ825_11825 [Gemmatimonadaceae bacterium]|nr:hypothetical protein [Gemmatimonadaceae bacterium]
MRITAAFYSPLILLLSLACSKRESAGNSTDTSVTAATPVATPPSTDSITYQLSWNMGRDPDEPENSYKSRFTIAARQTSSGRIDILLSADSAGRSAVADSVGVSGLTSADHFTLGCLREQNAKQIVAILRDSVYERRSHPRFAWAVDTLSGRFIQLAPDSLRCFIAGPD